jgi:hypothetical protein
MIGLLLHTFHDAPVPCSNTMGAYLVVDEYTAGIFKNSECRLGAWAGWAPETNTITLGLVKAKAGLVAGLVAGYKARPVFSLLVPSVAVSLDERWWLRASYLAKVKTSTTGVTLSIEHPF